MSQPIPPTKTRVAVIFGGPGPEHEVSLGSAQAVLRAGETLGWDALAMGVGKDGHWYVGPGAFAEVLSHGDAALFPIGVAVDPRAERLPFERYDGPPPRDIFTGYNLTLPLCHGSWGEDGALQGLLTTYGLKVIGCGVTASAVCFDKQITKAVLTAAGIPVTRGVPVKRQDWIADPDAALQRALVQAGDAPWFVKPNRSGSSIGAAAAMTPEDLPGAVEEAFRWDDVTLIEPFIQHRELQVGIIGREELTVSPPMEHINAGRTLDYADKYQHAVVTVEEPSDLGPELIEKARDLARAAFEALGCETYARVDLFLDTRNNQLSVNEVNTIPGLTQLSAFPELMAKAGIPFTTLLASLCQLTEEIR